MRGACPAVAGDLGTAGLPDHWPAPLDQRKPHQVGDDEAALTAAIIRLASEYGR